MFRPICADASISPLCADGSEPGRVLYLYIIEKIRQKSFRVAVAVAGAEAELETNIELILDQNLKSNLCNIGLKIYLNS